MKNVTTKSPLKQQRKEDHGRSSGGISRALETYNLCDSLQRTSCLLPFSGGSKISQTGGGETPNQSGGASLLFRQNFLESCKKMKEIKSWGVEPGRPLGYTNANVSLPLSHPLLCGSYDLGNTVTLYAVQALITVVIKKECIRCISSFWSSIPEKVWGNKFCSCEHWFHEKHQ